MSESLITQNTAQQFGVGIANGIGAKAMIANSTITENVTEFIWGGVANSGTATLRRGDLG